MTKTTNALEDRLGGNTGWILLMLLVAGSSFLLGTSVNNKTGEQSVALEPLAPTSTVIGDIAETVRSNPPADSPNIANDTVASPVVFGEVSINSAGQAELESLPGIGPAKAQAIIAYRAQFGPFVRIEDIEKVKGIGPKTFANFKAKITL